MDNYWLRWAFFDESTKDLGPGEKLVLVYLASICSDAGVGRYTRDNLAAATQYEPRSLQRILKNLRDGNFLREESGWYSLRGAVAAADMPPVTMADGGQMSPPYARVFPLFNSEELAAIGDEVQKAILEASNGLLTRFNDASLRLLQGIEKIAIAARVEELAREPEPPPDPVRESTHFKVFMASGFVDEAEAYALAQKRLEAEGLPAGAGPGPDTPLPVKVATLVPKGQVQRDSRQYLDTQLGRFERVRDILDPTGVEPWADAMAVWTRLELAENKHTVEGETDAFELLYPAIVQGARRWAGKTTLAEFLDEKAIKANRAPWDFAPAAANNDAEIQAELASMLDELERVNHPMAQAPPRTVDGALTEPLAAYHLRVKRVHQQLKMLQEKGI